MKTTPFGAQAFSVSTNMGISSLQGSAPGGPEIQEPDDLAMEVFEVALSFPSAIRQIELSQGSFSQGPRSEKTWRHKQSGKAGAKRSFLIDTAFISYAARQMQGSETRD